MTPSRRSCRGVAAVSGGRDGRRGGIRAPRWLPPGARELYRQLAPQVPGFDPVLDSPALEAYALVLAQKRAVEEALAAASTEEERASLRAMLDGLETEAREWAETLGLTPKSRREIVQAIRARRGLWGKLFGSGRDRPGREEEGSDHDRR